MLEPWRPDFKPLAMLCSCIGQFAFINPFMTNGVAHHYHLSPFSFLGESGVILNFHINS